MRQVPDAHGLDMVRRCAALMKLVKGCSGALGLPKLRGPTQNSRALVIRTPRK